MIGRYDFETLFAYVTPELWVLLGTIVVSFLILFAVSLLTWMFDLNVNKKRFHFLVIVMRIAAMMAVPLVAKLYVKLMRGELLGVPW